MKIAFFIFSLRDGGAERITSYMANHWASQGHSISVITMTGEQQDSYPLSPDIALARLCSDKKSTGSLSAISNNIRRIFSLRKALIKLQPDLVISMMPTANITAALAVQGLGIKCIGSERNYPPFDELGGYWRFLQKHVYRFLDSIVIQTKIGQEWIKANTNARSTVVIPNPVVLPIPNTTPAIPVFCSPEKKLILGVGRLAKQKQFDHLIDAFAMIAENHHHADLVILGDGDARAALESQIKELNLTDRIFLPGRAGNIAEWLSRANLYVLSSEYEGFPNALLEAMAHGVPCVSYDCLTGPAEIIVNNENGILVEANNINELSSSIERVINDADLQNLFLNNSKHTAVKFDLQTIMDSWTLLATRIVNPKPH